MTVIFWDAILYNLIDVRHTPTVLSYRPLSNSIIFVLYEEHLPIPVAEQSKMWSYGRSLAGITGSNAAGSQISVCWDYCLSSGKGLCDGPITPTEESEQVCVCVCVCV